MNPFHRNLPAPPAMALPTLAHSGVSSTPQPPERKNPPLPDLGASPVPRPPSPSIFFHHWAPPQTQIISSVPVPPTTPPRNSSPGSSPGSQVRPTGAPSYRRSFDLPPLYTPLYNEVKDMKNTIPENTYRYQPLASNNNIRILKLLAGEPRQEIACELITMMLTPQACQPNIQYAALSYCWGLEDACSGIRIHPQKSSTDDMSRSFRETTAKIYIKSNLYAALQQFREAEQEVYLWVDALCIDQENKREKALQISKMQEIYNKATNVCIWLGPATLISEVALPFIKEVLNLEEFDMLIKDGSSRHKWHALANLMRNRWFSRRWVIQELTLARNATIHCGGRVVHWNDFADAVALFVTKLDQIKELFPQSRPHTTGSDTLNDIQVLGANVLVHASSYLFRKSPDGDILERLRTMETLMSTLLPFEATDPKDTIYAVLSLAKDEPGHKIIPDYSKDLAEVCTDFIKSCIESSGSLDIICRHWAPIHRSFSHPNFPSWIPSISGSAFGAPEDALNGRANGDSFVGDPGRYNYNASLGFPPASVRFGLHEDNQRQNPDSSTLSSGKERKLDGTMYVKGFTLDTIADIAPRAAFGLIFREGLDMAGWPQDHTSTPERIPDELWRTLVADRGPDGSSPPSWYHRACLYCLAKRDTSGDINTGELITDEDSPEMMVEFLKRVQSTIWNRRFFKSAKDIKGKRLFGLAPENARHGDVLCILFGCSVPVVLRPHNVSLSDGTLAKRRRGSARIRKESIAEESVNHFIFIGECYIYGMMDGEAKDIYGQDTDSWTQTYKLC